MFFENIGRDLNETGLVLIAVSRVPVSICFATGLYPTEWVKFFLGETSMFSMRWEKIVYGGAALMYSIIAGGLSLGLSHLSIPETVQYGGIVIVYLIAVILIVAIWFDYRVLCSIEELGLERELDTLWKMHNEIIPTYVAALSALRGTTCFAWKVYKTKHTNALTKVLPSAALIAQIQLDLVRIEFNERKARFMKQVNIPRCVFLLPADFAVRP